MADRDQSWTILSIMWYPPRPLFGVAFTVWATHFQIYDPNVERYEVPIPLNLQPKPLDDPLYEVTLVADVGAPFSVRVARKSTGTILWVVRLILNRAK
jgi:N-terminal barrel of NtMGAM and CtMGAM, maltase-glucoamylase